MKKSIFFLASLLIPMISIANTYLPVNSYSELSIASITQVFTISFMSNMLLKFGLVILNTSLDYIIISVIISLIIILLLKAFYVIVSLKELGDAQKRLLERKNDKTIL